MTVRKVDQIRAEIVDLLESMDTSDRWPIPVKTIGALVEHSLKNWQRDIESELTTMIKDWETMIPEGDKSLYSLGLRHARDILLGMKIDKI